MEKKMRQMQQHENIKLWFVRKMVGLK